MQQGFFENKVTLKEVIYIVGILLGASTQYYSLLGEIKQIVNDAKLENKDMNFKITSLQGSFNDLKKDYKEHLLICYPPIYAQKPKEIKLETEN